MFFKPKKFLQATRLIKQKIDGIKQLKIQRKKEDYQKTVEKFVEQNGSIQRETFTSRGSTQQIDFTDFRVLMSTIGLTYFVNDTVNNHSNKLNSNLNQSNENIRLILEKHNEIQWPLDDQNWKQLRQDMLFFIAKATVNVDALKGYHNTFGGNNSWSRFLNYYLNFKNKSKKCYAYAYEMNLEISQVVTLLSEILELTKFNESNPVINKKLEHLRTQLNHYSNKYQQQWDELVLDPSLVQLSGQDIDKAVIDVEQARPDLKNEFYDIAIQMKRDRLTQSRTKEIVLEEMQELEPSHQQTVHSFPRTQAGSASPLEDSSMQFIWWSISRFFSLVKFFFLFYDF
jgi:hypothetical protein